MPEGQGKDGGNMVKRPRMSGYKHMAKAMFTDIKEKIASHPKLAKNKNRMAGLCGVSDTTIAKVMMSETWGEYQKLNRKLNAVNKEQNNRIDSAKMDIQPSLLTQATTSTIEEKKPTPPARIAAAVAKSVAEKTMMDRQGIIVVTIPAGYRMEPRQINDKVTMFQAVKEPRMSADFMRIATQVFILFALGLMIGIYLKY